MYMLFCPIILLAWQKKKEPAIFFNMFMQYYIT